jgi:hypothetical protein
MTVALDKEDATPTVGKPFIRAADPEPEARRVSDPEIKAMADVWKLVAGVAPQTRLRVLEYLTQRAREEWYAEMPQQYINHNGHPPRRVGVEE